MFLAYLVEVSQLNSFLCFRLAVAFYLGLGLGVELVLSFDVVVEGFRVESCCWAIIAIIVVIVPTWRLVMAVSGRFIFIYGQFYGANVLPWARCFLLFSRLDRPN